MFLSVLCVFILHYCVQVQVQAAILPTCSSVTDVRKPIGCYNTDVTLLSPFATFTYVGGYVSTTSLQWYCGLQCLSLGIPYNVLYNTTTCACVSVPVLASLILTVSSNCRLSCPGGSASGSLYCPTATPSLGAYWFCTPNSLCNEADIAQGNDVGIQHCSYTEFEERLEGDYVRAFCWTSSNCLQQNLYLQCVNGSWVSLAQTAVAVCLPCSQYPTTCSTLSSCNPVLPPPTCVQDYTTTITTPTIPTTTAAPTTTTTATTTVTSTASLVTTTTTLPTTTAQTTTLAQSNSTTNPSSTTVDLPWNGGNAEPLPSHQIYTLVNVTKYDSSDRPTEAKVPGLLTKVAIALTVQNIDSISELTSSFGLDMFFYQSWTDLRLEFNNISIVGPPGSFFQLTKVREQQQLWTPPVYVGNAKATEKIDPSKHNSVLFLNSNGEAAEMYREYTTAECKMNLQDYPFDTQICPIYLGLFGFYDKQVQLNWSVPVLFNMSNPPTPFSLNEKITLPAWTVVDYYITLPEDTSITDAVCAKFRTCLLAKIVLKRKSSFYIIDTFLPNMIIMAGSCLTLWINPENVPARISMAVTLFLTFQATSLNVRSKLPNVTYVKAIDIWLFFGQGCLFCVMAEFLIIHTILNGYIKVRNWRICSMFDSTTKSVQTEDDFNDYPQSGKLSRQEAAKNIEKIARVIFPLAMIIFAIVYFSVYLSK